MTKGFEQASREAMDRARAYGERYRMLPNSNLVLRRTFGDENRHAVFPTIRHGTILFCGRCNAQILPVEEAMDIPNVPKDRHDRVRFLVERHLATTTRRIPIYGGGIDWEWWHDLGRRFVVWLGIKR